MILISTQDQQLAANLAAELNKLKARVTVIDTQKPDFLEALYTMDASALIIDSSFPGLPAGATKDILNSLALRIPVLLLKNPRTQEPPSVSPLAKTKRSRLEFSASVSVLEKYSTESIIATLDASGALGERSKKSWRRAVPYYNPVVPTKLLVENGGIGILTIDASSFRKVEVEFGADVFLKVREVFQKILNEMWGKPGCFRSTDILCRRSDHGNVYFVFLNRARSTGNLPLPGVLENIADRVNKIIHNALWAEVLMKKPERRLPECVESMPSVVVGFASAMHNPCLDPSEIIESAVEVSNSVAKIQTTRMRDRQKELMHTLIQSDHLLHPNYQAVFKLPNLTKKMVDETIANDSIKGLEKLLFGFEALIRVRVGEVKSLLGNSPTIIDPNFLCPDVLFAIAKSVKVGLELDQACMRLAAAHAQKLPGCLMVNILPRNLYFTDYLTQVFKARNNVILEISESEAINNVDLIKEVQKQMRGKGIEISADDFGRGFAGLDRVIQIKPHLIKFDRSLITNIHIEPVKRAYVNGLVESARLLGTKVLAEGVEIWEEAQVVQDMGIDYIQGFLLHKAESAEIILGQLFDNAFNEQDDVA